MSLVTVGVIVFVVLAIDNMVTNACKAYIEVHKKEKK